jgi:hypothetical protein
LDRVDVIVIHGVAEATPVEGGAEPLVLSEYLLPRLEGELAAAFDESLASEVPPRSTTFWTAIEAWSTPGSHSVS